MPIHRLLYFLPLFAFPTLADWPHYGGDAASTRFAPYDQIHPGNIDSLRIVWRWRVSAGSVDQEENGDRGMGSEFKSTPLVVDGVLYTSTPLSSVVALDAATGQLLWSFEPKARTATEDFDSLHKGVAYWSDGEHARIFFGTASDILYSLNASTGKLDPAFGQEGRVDLTKGMVRPPDPERYGLISPPTVCRDVLVVGSTIMDWHSGTSPDPYSSPGDVRGYDVRTGELLWTFHTIPQPGEYGNDTWQGDSWQHFGHANAWAAISADKDLGYVYLSLSTPSHNWYGGERPGTNLFGDSIVCLNARTGERVWHYQLVHHGLWNYDPPAAPVLGELAVEGHSIAALAMISKQAYTYVFDRVTGTPVWPIREKPAPPSTIESDQPWPTQPAPSRPAPYDLQGLSEDDFIDFTPELRAEALKIVAPYRYGPLFTPPSLEGTIAVPGDLGGSDWAGAAVNPQSGVLYVPSRTRPSIHRLTPIADSTAFSRYGGSSQIGLQGPQGLPLPKPPYGRLTAIDLNTGDHLWVRPIGRGPRDHPALRHLKLEQDLGWPVRTFVIATPPLLLTASGQPRETGDYFVEAEAHLKALNPATGLELTRIELPANATGAPLSYLANGRQYIAVPVGGDLPSELVVLALPQADEDLPPQARSGYGADHPVFDRAVEAFDSGDEVGLLALLSANPDLVKARGFLHELYPHPSLRGATLLHLVAGYPQRARLPDNVLDLGQLLIDRGADVQALSADSTSVINLIVKSAQLRWRKQQIEAVDLIIAEGIGNDPRLMWHTMVPPLQREVPSPVHLQLAQRFYEGGATVDLPFAAALGLDEEMAAFFDEAGKLQPEANVLYRPRATKVSDQELLDQALLYAVYGGQTETATFLLDRGAAIDGRPNGGFWETFTEVTPMHIGVWADRPEMVVFLLERGANPTIADKNFGAPPVAWATHLTRETCREHLLAAMQEWQVKTSTPTE